MLAVVWLLANAQIIQVRKNSMPKLARWQGGPKQRFIVKELYDRDVSSQRYRPSNWVWLRSEIKQNNWSTLKKKVVSCTSPEQTLKHMTTDLSVKLMTQQRLMCVLKNARPLPDGCCLLNDTGNEILFRINTSLPLTMITGLDRASQCLGLPGHQTSYQWTSYGTTLKPWFTHCQLILKRIILPVLLRQQKPSGNNLAFLSTRQSLLCCCTLCIEVGGQTFEHMNI